MVIEDTAATALGVADALEDAGFEAVLCGSGREALEALRMLLPDCVVLDITSRDGTSVAVDRELRLLGVPFVIQSGWARATCPRSMARPPSLKSQPASTGLVRPVEALVNGDRGDLQIAV